MFPTRLQIYVPFSGIMIMIVIYTAIIFNSCRKGERFPEINTNFNGNLTTILVGESIAFTDLSFGEPSQWLWEFEGGSPAISTEQNPRVTYYFPGTFTVKLTSSNLHNSNTEIKTGFIKVLSYASASFSVSDSIIDQGNKINFTNNSGSELNQLLWEFEGGNPSSSTEMNPSIFFSEAGVFNVKLSVSNGLSTSSMTKRVFSMPTDQLVAYYPFNGNPLDATGNGHDGIAVGEIRLTSNRFGNEYSAYEFDGKDDYIQTSSMFDYATRSLSVWVNPYDISGSDPTAKVAITQDGTELNYGLLRVDFQDNHIVLRAGGNYGIYVNPVEKTGTWLHLVLIRENNLTRYYINNLLVLTSTSDSYTSTYEPNSNFIIGAGRSMNKQFFKGKIDDIRIYRKALKESEIQALFYGH